MLMLVNQCMEVLTIQEQGCTVTENVRGHAMGIWERVYNTEKFVLLLSVDVPAYNMGVQ